MAESVVSKTRDWRSYLSAISSERLFGPLAVGDVAKVNGQAFAGGVAVALEPTIQWLGIELLEVYRLTSCDGAMIFLIKLRALSVRKHIPDAFSEKLLRAHTDDARPLFAEVGVAPVLVQHRQAVGDATEHALQFMVCLAEFLFRSLAVGHVHE